MLKPYIEYVHVKDARMADGEVVVPGTGRWPVSRKFLTNLTSQATRAI